MTLEEALSIKADEAYKRILEYGGIDKALKDIEDAELKGPTYFLYPTREMSDIQRDDVIKKMILYYESANLAYTINSDGIPRPWSFGDEGHPVNAERVIASAQKILENRGN